MKRCENDKENLIILDFDGTLYHNPKQNFTLDIAFEDILDADQFFHELVWQVELFNPYDFAHNTYFILLTGRSYSQKDVILLYLREKGYKIDEAYFCNYDFLLDPYLRMNFDENAFKIKYWSGKVELIYDLFRSDKYNSITIIDDDKIICSMIKELGFMVIRAEIQYIGLNLQVKFHPFNQKCNLHLLEEEVVIHG